MEQQYVVQVCLPRFDSGGQLIDPHILRRVADELTARFGRITHYSRVPIKGLWSERAEDLLDNYGAVFEVVAPDLDRPWWEAFQGRLRSMFPPDLVAVRAHSVMVM